MEVIANAYRTIKRKSFRNSSRNLPERNSRLSTMHQVPLPATYETIEPPISDVEFIDKPIKKEQSVCETTPQSPKVQHDDEKSQKSNSLQSHNSRNDTLKKSKTNSLEHYTGKSFWEIDGYKKVLDRCDDGHELGSKLNEMIAQRSKIEENYARDLQEWSKRWTKYLKNETTEYGTVLNSWYSLVETTEKTTDISLELCNKLNNNLVNEIKRWLNDNYQIHIVNFNVQKQFRSEFEEAQKPWKENYEKMEEAKRSYYDLIKKFKKAEEIAKLAQSDIEKTEEQRRRLQYKADQLKSKHVLAREKYIDEVKNMDISRDRYKTNMKKVFTKTQEFEKQRKDFFKKIFTDFCTFLLDHVRDKRFEEYITCFNQQIELVNVNMDLDWWSEKKGADMDYNWPIFEEYFGY
jgi:protein kinase C and casein kinase substrate in neurons protein